MLILLITTRGIAYSSIPVSTTAAADSYNISRCLGNQTDFGRGSQFHKLEIRITWNDTNKKSSSVF